MSKIANLRGREILDSRGNPTVEVEIVLGDKLFGRASVPSGASTGSHEARELRDGGKRYGGRGVQKAVGNVNDAIREKILGGEFNQSTLDKSLIELDGTKTKEKLGANAILGVSMAFAHAKARSEQIELFAYFARLAGTEKRMRMPIPMLNVLNGGRHARRSTDLQEFMLWPHGAKTFAEALRTGAEIVHTLRGILEERNLNTNLGDEGGFAPELQSNEAALEFLVEAIEKAGYVPGKDVSLCVDAAATEFYRDSRYHFASEKKILSSAELVKIYEVWAAKYPIFSIEDGLAEDDWDGFQLLTKKLGSKIQIVGDDLFATNKDRLVRGIKLHVANAILIKPNQVGTVTETIEAVQEATRAGFACIVSHRSGETEDTTIADLAVGLGVGQIKAGAPARGERTAKYNRLLRIAELLDARESYR
ncbi:phosphopyruvate hydratase [Candidatus Kaiserbacteria bacterium]|nr:phosphopyruvate hydratase [Candidatus Kaiserbacteria bacterium]